MHVHDVQLSSKFVLLFLNNMFQSFVHLIGIFFAVPLVCRMAAMLDKPARSSV